MSFLIVAGIGLAFILYVAAIFIVGGWIQDRMGRFAVAVPWMFTMFFLIVVPAAIVVQVTAK